MKNKKKTGIVVAVLALASLGAGASACKGSPSSSAPPEPAKEGPLAPLATAAGLPVRQFHLQTDFEPGKPVDTGEAFTMDGAPDGELFETGADAIRAKFQVKEVDGTMNTITPRAAVYVEPNLLKSQALRALCATEVTVIDRGAAPIGHAYSFDTAKGSRLLCWINVTSGPKQAWQEIEIASSRDIAGGAADPHHDMLWSFAITGSREEARIDVVYAQDAEWTPQYFHAIGRTEREKGFERTIRVNGDGKPVLDTLVDGEFPDFTILQTHKQPGADACQFQCGMVWDGSSWNSCGGCANGETCIAGQCQAGGKTCKPIAKDKACDATACGKFSDGCGGQIDCGNSCPSGTTCGADGAFRRCGKRLNPKTADEIRSTYADTNRQLCGLFADPATSSKVDLGGCPDADQTCNNNLCNPLRVVAP